MSVKNSNKLGRQLPRRFTAIKRAGYTVAALGALATAQANALWVDISFEDFENGFIGWEDGGNDVFLRKNTEHRSSGVNSANIQDDSGPKSTIRQKAFDASIYQELNISFWYKPVSMELGEFFRIQFQEANGKWANLADYVKGEEFVKNGQEYAVDLTIHADDYDFGTASRFRIRNFGNTNADDVYIDDILVSGNTPGLPVVENWTANVTVTYDGANSLILSHLSGEENISFNTEDVTHSFSVETSGSESYEFSLSGPALLAEETCYFDDNQSQVISRAGLQNFELDITCERRGTPTPTPTSAPGHTTTLEAESGVMAGGDVRTVTDGAASGGSVVAYMEEVGESLSFTNVPASDTITLRYATVNTGALSVRVNSADVADLSFNATGGWVGAYQEASLSIDIPDNATVEFFIADGDMAMNIDTVTFSLGDGSTPDTPTPTPTPGCIGSDCITPTPTPTPTGSCGVEEDPAADLGEGYVVGMTKGGLVYHRAIEGHSPSFVDINSHDTQEFRGKTDVGPFLFQEKTLSSDAYNRYESQLASVDPDTSYRIEVKIQGDQFGSGQCIRDFSFKPGEGATVSDCFVGGSTGPVEPPPPPSVTATLITDATNGKARLVGGPGSEREGHSLYTFAQDTVNVSNCDALCEVNWPKVTVPSEQSAFAAGGVTGEFGVIPVERTVTDACGITETITEYHVTYNGAPLYFFNGNNAPGETNGVSATWPLADVDLIPQLPLVKHPAPALKTPVLGKKPRLYGFTFDLDGRDITWHAGYDPGQGGHLAGLAAQFSAVSGDGALGAKDPNLEFWCSNNQIQFHKADMPGALGGPYKATIPAACYGEYYYFFRYRMRGQINNDPEGNWVYSALFEFDESRPTDRIDPDTRESVTYRSSNWQRHGHPHSRDRTQDFITFDAQPYNSALISGLERYETTFIDEPNNTQIIPHASRAPMRIELLEYGAGNCAAPSYVIGMAAQNTVYPIIGHNYDYGQILSWEASFGGGNNGKFGGGVVGSQVYNTMQHVTIGGGGFETPTGDPRLNSAGRGSVYMVNSDGCNPVEKYEKSARFTQHLISVVNDFQVNDFLLGHDLFHGMEAVTQAKPGGTGFAGSKEIRSTDGVLVKPAGQGACGDCHFRDGRSEYVFDTPNGPRLAPPTYGVGLLEWIEGAEAGLTWTGEVKTVREQAENALHLDLGLTPADIGQTEFDRVVEYTKLLHVPVRRFGSYADPDVAEGEVAFHEVGCASCHQPTQKTRSGPEVPVEFRDLYIRPFTDMKTYDVGTGGTFRTAPLWGIGENLLILDDFDMNTLFMHDGRATSLEAAIDAHGNGSVPAITPEQKSNIVKFIKTL